MTLSRQPNIDVSLARAVHRPVLEQLWTMFRHDMSAFSGALPNAAGRFRQERLDAAFEQPDWAGYILQLGSAPVGLAVVRGLNDDERTISSFFLVHGARRSGNGRAAMRTITRQHPGRWAVAFQDANMPAAGFWRSVASEADQNWSIEYQSVPNRPDLSPDSWVRFSVR